METDNISSLYEQAAEWGELLAWKTTPVLTDELAAEVASKLFVWFLQRLLQLNKQIPKEEILKSSSLAFFNVSTVMNGLQMPKLELIVLELFYEKNKLVELSPRMVEAEFELGDAKVIDLFLDLELKGLIKWNTLDLMELNLAQSTTEIYREVFNSLARITDNGELMLEHYQSEQAVAWKSEIQGKWGPQITFQSCC